mmetsp:Transcript_15208/g.25742  ORF Transcript_15208/g.25742 Transcript_15208/m.25742 type:complete len:285 (-) Transcript_15208:369-1223(-)
MHQMRSKNLVFNSMQLTGYARVHIFKTSWTIRQVRIRIYEILRPMIKQIPRVNKTSPSGAPLSPQEIIAEEYRQLFTEKNGSLKFDNELYDLEIHNNLPIEEGWLYNKIPRCDFCDQQHKDNCFLAFDGDVKLSKIIESMKYPRDLDITINWKANAKVDFSFIERVSFKKINLNRPTEILTNTQRKFIEKAGGKQTIYDCLSIFSHEETLAGSNMWYCSKCKEHVPALKKMQIYNTPEFLIIHLKRFSHQRNSYFGSSKINSDILFPLQTLDMTPYIVDKSEVA